MKKWLRIFSDKLNITGGFISGLSILIIGLIVTYEVVLRYLFNAPTTWVLEISIYLCIACVFLAGGYALKEKQHIYVDVVTNKLSERNRILFQIISLAISLVYTAVLTWKGAGMAYHAFIMHEVSPTVLNVPVAIPHAVVPIGGFMLIVEFIRQIWEGIDDFRKLEVEPSAKKNPLLE
ncbi:TRAP transporter small permease, partial [bacterium]|nr:TRAP transporter small permease [bacterium]